MSSRSATKTVCRARRCCGALLGGCSDIYFDRRDTVSLDAGDAMAANRVTQMIDPWPAASGQRNIAFNGERMQAAVERYRTDNVIPPVSATTSSARQQQPPAPRTEAIPTPAPGAPIGAGSSPIK